MPIRDANIEDAPSIRSLLAQLGYLEQSEKEVQEKVLLHSTDGYRILVATEDGRVIGFMTLHWCEVPHRRGRLGRITAMCTDEAVRSKGVGHQLLQEAETILSTMGCHTIEVTSNNRRARAHRFYLNNGYRETSKRFVKEIAGGK